MDVLTPQTLVPAIRKYRAPRHRVGFSLAVTEDNVALAVTNYGAPDYFMGKVMDWLGDEDLHNPYTNDVASWLERDDLGIGANGYEETCRIPKRATRHIVLPMPRRRYVARVRLWDSTGNTPWTQNLVATVGSRTDRGITTAGFTAWLIDEPLIWARWSVGRDVELSQ